MNAKVKAYGKVMLFGAYCILEPGNICLVLNVDKGTTVNAEETDPGKIVIDLSNFKINVYGSIENGKLALNKNPETIKFIKNAVEYSFEYLNLSDRRIKDIKMQSVNDSELYVAKKKCGFGTSASSTVAAVAAILRLHDIDDRALVYKIARYSHYKSQGGIGSGFDVAASCFGSHFFISDNSDIGNFADYIKTEVKIPATVELPSYMYPMLIFTGQSASTENLVKKVLDYKKSHPKEYYEFMKEYNQINLAARNSFFEGYPSRTRFFLEKSWQMRKQLGAISRAPIEPDKYTMLIEELKKNGAFTAGLAGAGGGDTIIAICQSKEDKEILTSYLDKINLDVLDLKLASKPYEIEGETPL